MRFADIQTTEGAPLPERTIPEVREWIAERRRELVAPATDAWASGHKTGQLAALNHLTAFLDREDES